MTKQEELAAEKKKSGSKIRNRAIKTPEYFNDQNNKSSSKL